MFVLLPTISILTELLIRKPEDGSFLESSRSASTTCFYAGKNLHSLPNGRDGVNMELLLSDRLDDLFPQHQIRDVLHRDHHTLVAGEAPRFAHVVEAFDLEIDPPDGLNFSLLIDGPGDGNVLPERQAGQTRQNGIELRCRFPQGSFQHESVP